MCCKKRLADLRERATRSDSYAGSCVCAPALIFSLYLIRLQFISLRMFAALIWSQVFIWGVHLIFSLAAFGRVYLPGCPKRGPSSRKSEGIRSSKQTAETNLPSDSVLLLTTFAIAVVSCSDFHILIMISVHCKCVGRLLRTRTNKHQALEWQPCGRCHLCYMSVRDKCDKAQFALFHISTLRAVWQHRTVNPAGERQRSWEMENVGKKALGALGIMTALRNTETHWHLQITEPGPFRPIAMSCEFVMRKLHDISAQDLRDFIRNIAKHVIWD